MAAEFQKGRARAETDQKSQRSRKGRIGGRAFQKKMKGPTWRIIPGFVSG